MWRSQSWSGIACRSGVRRRSGCKRGAVAKPLLLAIVLAAGAVAFDDSRAQSPNSPGYVPPPAPWSAPQPSPPPRVDTAPDRSRIDRIEREIAGVRQQQLRVEQAQRNTPDPRDPSDPGQQAAEAARLAAEQSRLQAREDQLRRELTALQPSRK
jgi:hypothetical protein